jgi:hypothetical protein
MHLLRHLFHIWTVRFIIIDGVPVITSLLSMCIFNSFAGFDLRVIFSSSVSCITIMVMNMSIIIIELRTNTVNHRCMNRTVQMWNRWRNTCIIYHIVVTDMLAFNNSIWRLNHTRTLSNGISIIWLKTLDNKITVHCKIKQSLYNDVIESGLKIIVFLCYSIVYKWKSFLLMKRYTSL